MTKYIYLNISKQRQLPFFNQKEANQNSKIDKGWTYSYVYHFLELKNVYIALKKFQFLNKESFFTQAIAAGLPYNKTPWDSRRILEHLNALINFGLISKSYKIGKIYFVENEFTNILSKDDIDLFKKIYHEYFRFKEIHSWLLSPSQQNHDLFINEVTVQNMELNSTPAFTFSLESRFTDAFVFSLQDKSDIFRIPSTDGDLMRFWDVYIKWGQELQLIEKFNLKNLDIELAHNLKSISCVYYINPVKPDFDLLKFTKSEFSSNIIHIPKLILKIALRYRFSINSIKKMIIDQAIANSNICSLQRTSEIFIRDTEINFLPKYLDSYISHLHVHS